MSIGASEEHLMRGILQESLQKGGGELGKKNAGITSASMMNRRCKSFRGVNYQGVVGGGLTFEVALSVNQEGHFGASQPRDKSQHTSLKRAGGKPGRKTLTCGGNDDGQSAFAAETGGHDAHGLEQNHLKEKTRTYRVRKRKGKKTVKWNPIPSVK